MTEPASPVTKDTPERAARPGPAAVAGLPVSAELILSAGTTLGVATLALTALVPAMALAIVAYLLDGGELRAAVARVRRTATR